MVPAWSPPDQGVASVVQPLRRTEPGEGDRRLLERASAMERHSLAQRIAETSGQPHPVMRKLIVLLDALPCDHRRWARQSPRSPWTV
jgi:hypothetical protein